MTIYKNVNFAAFLDLIDKGKIGVSFRMSAFKSGPRYGQVHNHGTGFSVTANYLTDMYAYADKIY